MMSCLNELGSPGVEVPSIGDIESTADEVRSSETFHLVSDDETEILAISITDDDQHQCRKIAEHNLVELHAPAPTNCVPGEKPHIDERELLASAASKLIVWQAGVHAARKPGYDLTTKIVSMARMFIDSLQQAKAESPAVIALTRERQLGMICAVQKLVQLGASLDGVDITGVKTMFASDVPDRYCTQLADQSLVAVSEGCYEAVVACLWMYVSSGACNLHLTGTLAEALQALRADRWSPTRRGQNVPFFSAGVDLAHRIADRCGQDVAGDCSSSLSRSAAEALVVVLQAEALSRPQATELTPERQRRPEGLVSPQSTSKVRPARNAREKRTRQAKQKPHNNPNQHPPQQPHHQPHKQQEQQHQQAHEEQQDEQQLKQQPMLQLQSGRVERPLSPSGMQTRRQKILVQTQEELRQVEQLCTGGRPRHSQHDLPGHEDLRVQQPHQQTPLQPAHARNLGSDSVLIFRRPKKLQSIQNDLPQLTPPERSEQPQPSECPQQQTPVENIGQGKKCMVKERMIDAMSEQRVVRGGEPSPKRRRQIDQQEHVPVRHARKAISAETILGAGTDNRASGGVVGDADRAELSCSESTDSSLSD